MKLYLFLSMVLLSSCKTQKNLESETASASSTIIGTRDFFDPSGKAWTGRLILPKTSERRPDGGVWFEVYQGAQGQTFSKPIWLTWNRNSEWFKEYDQRTKIDVNISPSDFEYAKTSKNIIPERLSGLPKVSFLESLAGSRPEKLKDTINGVPTVDSIEVFIEKAAFSGDTLTLDSEPVQITGRFVSLLKFVQKLEGRKYAAKAWSQGGFSSDMTVSYQDTRKDPKQSASQPVLEGIEKIGANHSGWYAFGDSINGTLEVRALEPRAAMMMNEASDYPDGKHYIDVDNFKDTEKSKTRISTAVIGNKNVTNRIPNRGSKGLVLHVFGGIGGKDGDAPINIPLIQKKYYTGHFAFGVGKVVLDPFTNENKIDIEYRQIYGNGPDGIVSGAIKWHVYSGSLERGWMYSRPISDAVIWNPALSAPFNIAGKTIDPIAGILLELDVMAARFRSADGQGVAKVTSTKSCVQDSNQAAYISLAKFLDRLDNSPEMKSGIATLDAPTAKRLQKLKTIAYQYRDRVIGPARLRVDWKKAVDAKENPILAEPFAQLPMIFASLKSLGILTPNGSYEKILNILYDNDSLIWFVRTNQVGGIKPDIFPIAPGFN